MPYAIPLIIIQILFAVHALRTGRDRWLYLILLMPGLGSLIYFIVEFLPELRRSRGPINPADILKKLFRPPGNLKAKGHKETARKVFAEIVDSAHLATRKYRRAESRWIKAAQWELRNLDAEV